MNTFTRAAASLGLCGLAALANAANTATDFSATDNPNGNWQYGYETSLGGAFTLYDHAIDRGTAMTFWTASSLGVTPSVAYNPTSSPIDIEGLVFQPYQTVLHPGPNDEYSLFRWTAPSTDAYRIQADFLGVGDKSTTDIHILVDGVSIYAGSINGYGLTATFKGTRQLSAGSIVDFAVGRGADNYLGDTTGINATITPVPEPETWTLMAAGLFAVAHAKRRARRA